MIRLDKLLTELNIGSRSQVKDYLRQGMVTVNGETIRRPELKVEPDTDRITFAGKALHYEKFQYYLLNKPANVVSATRDALSETVLSLLPPEHREDLFPVGRLDKDTEGLLLITNDGELAHELLSPKRHVTKTYLVQMAHPISEEERLRLEDGLDIGDETPTKPARAVVLTDCGEGDWLRLSISEGRYHQVKRMLQAIGNEVLYLKRVRFGALRLDEALKPGECRRLTEEEISDLKSSQRIIQEKQKLIAGKKAVIFDLDGSLVDSMWVWPRIDQEYLARFGIEMPLEGKEREELRSAIEGMSCLETALHFQKQFGISDSTDQMIADWNAMAWDKYEKEVPLKDGIPEFLEGCRKQGILLGIATSNMRELVENVLKTHGILDQFAVIATGSEVTKGKPAPDIYLHVAQMLGVKPEECLVFEDIIPGIQAGKNAGMTVCAVADADSALYKEQIREAADYYTEDFYDFL